MLALSYHRRMEAHVLRDSTPAPRRDRHQVYCLELAQLAIVLDAEGLSLGLMQRA